MNNLKENEFNERMFTINEINESEEQFNKKRFK